MSQERVNYVIAKIGSVLVLAGLAVLAFQTYRWAQTDNWHFIPISRAFSLIHLDIPRPDWLGAQKVIDWVLDLPLAITLVVLGLLFRLAEDSEKGTDRK